MSSDLLFLVRVKDEVVLLCRELEWLEEALFKTASGEWDEVMEKKVRWKIAQVLKSQLPQGMSERRKALRELKEELLAMPVVKLTLAIEPTGSMIQEISDILRKSANAGIILDIDRDSLIVGGVVMSYQGRFGDFSIASEVERAWAENAEKLTKMAYGGN